MTYLQILIAGGALALAMIAASTSARPAVRPTGPDPISKTQSLAQLIATGRPVHIIYVHGMRAEGPGTSDELGTMLKEKLGYALTGSPQRHDVELGGKPDATYGGTPIWSDEDWPASRPFVIRTRYSHQKHGEIVLDEVNWWPLLFPLKCRFLLVPEHDLSGDDAKHLKLCGTAAPPYHDWLRPEDREILRRKSFAWPAARGNRWLKQQIMNWGLADAVIALGPMRHYINATMDDAFDYAREGSSPRDAFVIMSASLGSFAVLDAMRVSPTVREVVYRTNHLYFLANQFALLELARIDGIPPPAEGSALQDGAKAPGPSSVISSLRDWAQRTRDRAALVPGERPGQIIAFSDPSDILSYRVPPIPDAVVVNVLDRNGPSWLGLFADPGQAHTGHLRNKGVWKILLRP